MNKSIAQRNALPHQGPSFLKRLSNSFALARQRRKLARLDDSALWDMGITRFEAKTESQRSGWDAPSHWQR